MSEFDGLIQIICSATTNVDSRTSAERRLLELLSDPTLLHSYLPLLFTANDTVTFFLCIGLQRFIWKHWLSPSMLTSSDKEMLVNTVVNVLINKVNMLTYTRSKLEQVLATICILSNTLQPILNLLVQPTEPNCFKGLSAVHTLLESALMDDSKIDLSMKQQVHLAITQILQPLTNLACNSMVSVLSSPLTNDSAMLLNISLSVVKVIVTKLPLGEHISEDVISLLLSCIEISQNNTMLHTSAMNSIEIITEIIVKKYIPSSSSNAANNGVKAVDNSINILMGIVIKAVNQLKSFLQRQSLTQDTQNQSDQQENDEKLILALLEFILLFTETHIERCCDNGMIMHGFIQEIVNLTLSNCEVKRVSKLVSIWNELCQVDAAKEYIIQLPDSVVLNVITHMLNVSILSKNAMNPQLNQSLQNANAESVVEYVEEMKIDLVKDVHMNEILSKVVKLFGSASEKVDKEENDNELPQIGLQKDVINVIAILISENKVIKNQLFDMVSGIIGTHMRTVFESNGLSQMNEKITSVVLDTSFTLQLLPVILGKDSCSMIIEQLQSYTIELLAVNNSNSSSNYISKLYNMLIVNINHITGVLLLQFKDLFLSGQHKIFSTMLQCLYNIYTALASPTITSFKTVHINAALKSTLIALMQYLSILEVAQSADIISNMTLLPQLHELFLMLTKLDTLSIENYALLMLVQDSAIFIAHQNGNLANSTSNNNGVSMLLMQLTDLVILCETNINNARINSVYITLARYMSALDVITRHHVIVKPNKRQQLTAALSSLVSLVARIMRLLLHITNQQWEATISTLEPNMSDTSSLTIIHSLVRLTVVLTSGLLQCLGKKTFGKLASDVLEISCAFLESVTDTSGTMDINSLCTETLHDVIAR